MQNPKHQQGLTFISILIILGLIAFFTLLGLKIIPIYINHGRVKNAMAEVEQLENIHTMTSKEIIDSFQKRFYVGYVDHVTKDNIFVAKQGDYVKVEIEYEVVVPLCCHLSALAQFHEQFEKGEK